MREIEPNTIIGAMMLGNRNCGAFLWLLALSLVLPNLIIAPTAMADDNAARDPRNWPTMDRIISERYERAGKVMTLRVHARPTDYFNCKYRGTGSRLMPFTLMGGPLETLTGYIRKDLGKLLERQLEADPWLRITVQIRYDPERLSEDCSAQVDILKWSIGWQYPRGTLTPGRPEPIHKLDEKFTKSRKKRNLWRVMNGRKARPGQEDPNFLPTEESLLGTTISLDGIARLSNTYHCAFRHATRTHYSLMLHDGTGNTAHAYVPRSQDTKSLLDQLSLHREIPITIKGRVIKKLSSNYCRPQLQVTSWALPQKGK